MLCPAMPPRVDVRAADMIQWEKEMPGLKIAGTVSDLASAEGRASCRSWRMVLTALLLLGAAWACGPRIAFGAEAACSVEAAKAAAPSSMIIGDITDAQFGPKLKTHGGVALVAANELGDGGPEYCLITGKFVTNARTHKSANFAVGLPLKSAWNGKFLFQGCGYNCGLIWGPPTAAQLKKGYPVWVTDDGHHGKPGPSKRLVYPTDATWAVLAPGHSNADAVTDFDYRAVHTLTVLGKEFTRNYYRAQNIRYSYFVGCSDGGREGMKELTKYPSDYDGIVAGAPYFDMTNEMLTTQMGIQAQLRSRDAALTGRLFDLLDRITKAKCDAVDGVKDGLIQNPARCDFDPHKDLPICGVRTEGGLCFTQQQVDSLSIIFSGITNPQGEVLFPGFSISDPNDDLVSWIGFPAPAGNLQGPEPWSANPGEQPLGWYWSNGTIKDMVYDGSRSFNALKTLGFSFRKSSVGEREYLHAVLPEKTVARFEAKNAPGSGVTPAQAAQFLREGRKLIMYHGFSDGLITPFRTIQYYRTLAQLNGGYDKLRQNAELFMVPGMGHCGGGPGPNSFGQEGASALQPMDPAHDVVAALARWVEQGKPPTSLVATKYQGNEVTGRMLRTMPLCPFPEEARYSGSGDLNDAKNWVCSDKDARLLDLGLAGRRVGVGARLRPQ
jgi:hypothetical protein